jgi:hypothetical protein
MDAIWDSGPKLGLRRTLGTEISLRQSGRVRGADVNGDPGYAGCCVRLSNMTYYQLRYATHSCQDASIILYRWNLDTALVVV